jgi:hypothetical protein
LLPGRYGPKTPRPERATGCGVATAAHSSRR